MKKITKTKIIILSFIFILFSSVFSVVYAETAWQYKVDTIPVTVFANFPTQLECGNSSAQYHLKNPTFIIEPCSTYTTTSSVTNDPILINIKNKQDESISVTPKTTLNTTDNSSVYKLLAPIGNITTMNSAGCADGDKTCITNDIGVYLNFIFKFAIGLCAALAVVMLIINGVTYMGDESVFGKTEAKSKMFSAILGLIIALGAYALLNTINPALTGKGGLNIASANIIVDLPEAGDSTVDPNCKQGVATYSTSAPISSGTVNAVAKLKAGWSINKFSVSSSNNTMIIELKNGSTIDSSNIISIKPGAGNYSEVGVSEKMKTPKGTWKILSIKTTGGDKAVCNGSGSNMGASFWLLSPTTNGERGIGMHGNSTGTITNTAGCIRLTNSDLLALLPYVSSGIPVLIN